MMGSETNAMVQGDSEISEIGLYRLTPLGHILSRRMRWSGHVARIEKMKNAYKILVGKHEG
jgi:hypothetical protein